MTQQPNAPPSCATCGGPSWDSSSGGYSSSGSDGPPIGTWSDTSTSGDISGGGMSESGGDDS